MSNRPHIDDLFRKELGGMQHEASEALWQKLDAQLQPERDAYNKKDKKRRAAWLVLPLALLLGGGAVWYFAGGSSSNKQETITANAEKTTAKQTPASPENTINNTQPVTNTIPSTESNSVPNSPATGNNVQKPATVEQVSQPAALPNNNAAANSNRNNDRITVDQPNTPKIVSATAAKLKEKVPKNKVAASRGKKNTKAEPVEQIQVIEIIQDKPVDVGTVTVEGVKEEDKPATVKVEENKNEIIPPVEAVTEPAKKDEPKPEVKTVKAKTNNKAVAGKTGISVAAGTNLSSPFRKPGAFGGLMLTKTIGDKHIFAGLKMSSNQLEHQLISSEKQNQPMPETDAVIEKLTILQLPFGYEFKLNGKGKPATTFLQAGFEPAYITGLRTIYYDDNGIPGGPRTEVVNSPLLSKAVNRFNLSFIAGIRKQITPRIGISLMGGYSLIDITDKQYYNRTSTNNNLKYIQAGLLFRLNK